MKFFKGALILFLLVDCVACNQTIDESGFDRINYLDPNISFAEEVCLFNKSPFTGILINSKTELHTKTEQVFVDGKRQGRFTEWFKDGVLKTEKKFRNNSEQGIQKGYHYNGNLSYSYEAIRGKVHGKYLEFYPQGSLQIEEVYNMDSIVSSRKINVDGYVEVDYHIKNGIKYSLKAPVMCSDLYSKNR